MCLVRLRGRGRGRVRVRVGHDDVPVGEELGARVHRAEHAHRAWPRLRARVRVRLTYGWGC